MAIVLDAKTVPFSYWLCEKLNHCKSDIENPNQRKCVRVCIFVADSFSCFSSGDFFVVVAWSVLSFPFVSLHCCSYNSYSESECESKSVE